MLLMAKDFKGSRLMIFVMQWPRTNLLITKLNGCMMMYLPLIYLHM